MAVNIPSSAIDCTSDRLRRRPPGVPEQWPLPFLGIKRTVTADFQVISHTPPCNPGAALYLIHDRPFQVRLRDFRDPIVWTVEQWVVLVAFEGKLEIDLDVTALPIDIAVPRSSRNAALLHEHLDRKSTRLNSSHLGISYAV